MPLSLAVVPPQTPGPIGTDPARKMMSIAPTDGLRSLFWSQNRPNNSWAMIWPNLGEGGRGDSNPRPPGTESRVPDH